MRKNILKRIPVLLAAAVLVFSVQVHADIIYEPPDNFYTQHMDECTVTYYWNSYKVTADQAVTVVVSPEDDTPVTPLRSFLPGECFSTNTTYEKNSECWYYLPDFDNQDEGGWLNGAGVERLYDAELFEQDHIEEIRASVSLDISELDEVTVCAYPCGPVKETLRLSIDKGNQINKLDFSKSYTDAEGKRWGYLGYYYGAVNGWACVDDPDLSDTETAGPLTVSEVRGEKPAAAEKESRKAEETSDTEKETTAAERESEKTAETSESGKEERETQAPDNKGAARRNPLLVTGIAAGSAVLAAAVILILVLRKKK